MQSSHDEYAKRGTQPIGFNPTDLFYVVMIAVVCWMTYQAWGWTDGARQGPLAIGFVSLGLLLLGLVGQISNRAVAFACSGGKLILRSVILTRFWPRSGRFVVCRDL